MNLGAEPKKVAILGGLVIVAAISAYINLMPSTPAPANNRGSASRPTSPAKPATGGNAAALPSTPSQTPRGGAVRGRGSASGQGKTGEFRPVFRPDRYDARLDASKVDPALHTEILAKLHDVQVRGANRNLFQFGKAPPPPRPPAPKIIPKPLGPDGRPIDEQRPTGPPPEPVKPPPPPIPLRYYGYVDPKQSADKRAFFMEGEDIRIAAVGELIRQCYKVVEIGPKSAVVEDTQHSNRQTLTLQAESGT